jgi:hypothetical protein
MELKDDCYYAIHTRFERIARIHSMELKDVVDIDELDVLSEELH